MAWLRYAFVVCLIIQMSSSKPHKQRGLTRKTVRPCEQVSEALGVVIDKADTLIGFNPGTFQKIVSGVSTIDIFDSSERQRMICGLEDLDTLTQFLDAAEDLRLDYNFVKIVYDYFSVNVRADKYYAQQAIDENSQWENPGVTRRRLNLLKELEAFGFTGLDPVGEAALEMTAAYKPFQPNYLPVEPPSTLPLDAQCSQFTNTLRKLWNSIVRSALKHNPDASREYRDMFTDWTGLTLVGHNGMKSLVCALMGHMHNDGLDGIYYWIKDYMVLWSALRTGYPYLQEAFESAQRGVDYATGEPYSYTAYADLSGGKRQRRNPDVSHNKREQPMHYGGPGYGNYGGQYSGGPGYSGTNNGGPGYSGPGNSGPGYGGPGYSGPGYGGAGYSGPGYGGPGYSGPGYGGPDYSGPDFGGPGYGGPGYGGPGYGGPGYGYGGPDYGGPGYGNYQYPNQEEMLELYRNLATILDNIELMGLMSLTNDLK